MAKLRADFSNSVMRWYGGTRDIAITIDTDGMLTMPIAGTPMTYLDLGGGPTTWWRASNARADMPIPATHRGVRLPEPQIHDHTPAADATPTSNLTHTPHSSEGNTSGDPPSRVSSAAWETIMILPYSPTDPAVNHTPHPTTCLAKAHQPHLHTCPTSSDTPHLPTYLASDGLPDLLTYHLAMNCPSNLLTYYIMGRPHLLTYLAKTQSPHQITCQNHPPHLHTCPALSHTPHLLTYLTTGHSPDLLTCPPNLPTYLTTT